MIKYFLQKTFKPTSIFLTGCAYAVAIIAIFIGFAAISKLTSVAIGIGQFFIILLFGQIISAAGYILKHTNWHFLIRYSLHYLALFAAFCVIFIVNGNIKSSGGSAIFSAAIVFTFFYALVFLIVFFIKKSIGSLENKIPSKSDNKTKNKNSYSPRFK